MDQTILRRRFSEVGQLEDLLGPQIQAPVIVLGVAIALVVSIVAQPFAIGVLHRRAVLDIPNERSSHSVATPRGGGVVVVVALLLGLCFIASDYQVIGLGLTTLAAGLLGFLEDVRGVPVVARLVAQLMCSIPLLVASVEGTVPVWLLLPVGAVFIVSAINSVNFMDGINGITAGFCIAAGISYALVFGAISQPTLAGAALVVVAACIGFLPYNAGRARIFLGDSGSYGLGAATGGLCILSWTLGAQPEAALAPFAIYIADTATVVIRRLRAGEPIHEAHRTHVYQRLTDLGWTHQRVALFVAVLTLAAGVLGWLGLSSSGLRVVTDVAILSVAALYLLSPTLARRVTREGIGI